ncbi:hypothetical protein, partial [Mammaliicoccus sciuri]|uniref:hypothetical protein n=1 Tax=Mammaliicoccus sciuri TaxID=1296 RepID=UPI000D4C74DB
MLDLFNIEYLKNNVEVIPLSTAALALLGLLFTTIFKAVLEWRVNKAKIKADVISKSRVDWIQDIRKVFSEYFVMLDNLIHLSQKIHDTKAEIIKLENSIVYSDEIIMKYDIPLNKEHTQFKTIPFPEKIEDENYADVNAMYNKKIDQLVIDDKNFQSIFWKKYLEIEQKYMLLELYLPDNPNKKLSTKKEDEHRIIKDKINIIKNDIFHNIYSKANKK